MAEGIIRCNKITTRTEPIISVKQLKDRFLFGVPIVDNDGRQMPDTVLQDYIDIAASLIEHELDICIVPREWSGSDTEEKDYHATDYIQWGYFQLNNIPVIEVLEVRAVYPNSTVLTYPTEWYKIQKHDGVLRLIPTAGTLSQFMVDQGGHYFPEIFRSQGSVPLVWQIDYISGFKDGEVPKDVNAVIGLIAAIFALNIAGDLILGAGIASESLSLDGLNQAIGTTSSAEFHGYSSKVLEYRRQLFGTRENDVSALIPKLKAYYSGSNILSLI
jgi:hypothetical protein